jgi:hypothetical protein
MTVRSFRLAALLWLLSLVTATACRDQTPSEPPAAQAPPQAVPGADPAALPSANEPKAPGAAPSGAAPNEPATAGGLNWQDSKPFVRRAPKSSMRAAEYGVSGDDSTELTVFYFGPDQGGTVDANITRWLGQMKQPDGSDSASKAKREERNVGGIQVALLEVAGNYSGGMAMAGAPGQPPIDDALMLGAIATGPRGPVFFKLVGPRATVENARAGFQQMIDTLR